jgi:cellulose biosynthesis protein BcsQ
MKVVTIAAAKGGATKTTVTLSLAARATNESAGVAIFDLNGDQGDLTKWWILRGEPENPQLFEVDKISQGIEAVREEGWEWLFIDTPPSELDIIENSVIKSDAVVIPVRPSFLDVDAVAPVVEMCRQRRRPYAFLLSAVDAKMPKLTENAMTKLVHDGQVLATKISYCQPYITSIASGKGAAEIEKSLQTEIDHLWAEVKRLASTPAARPLPAFKGGRIYGRRT